jgi:dUTP pyrophosphatase
MPPLAEVSPAQQHSQQGAQPVLGVFCLPHAPEQLPCYQTEGAAGMDIRAGIEAPIVLQPLERTLIPTGLVFHIPQGFEVQLRARSGLAIKHGITLVNGIGTIDADYRDEVKVALINLGQEPFTIQPNDRICQMVVAPVMQASLTVITQTERLTSRQGGFGSTGVQ